MSHARAIRRNPPRAYRPNVGIALFDRQGRVLLARRIKDDGPEVIGPGAEWQMPQGGVDPGEDGEKAARRELWEETGVTTVEMLGRLSSPVRYDFPPYAGRPHKLAAFRGQEQTWYAMRFLGSDHEIDVSRCHDGEDVEFDAWRWEELDRVASLVVPFKRAVYERVAAEFGVYAGRGSGFGPEKDGHG